jgi:hypothetical protein
MIDLQKIVDEYAKKGMRDNEIRDLLWNSNQIGRSVSRSQAIPAPSISAQRIRSNLLEQLKDPLSLDKEPSDTELFARGYRAVGQTMLDRIIHGFGSAVKEIPGASQGLSNFEIMRDMCRGIQRTHGNNCETNPHDASLENIDILPRIVAAISPWLIGTKSTTNVQIDQDLAEAFLVAKQASSVDRLPDAPFYIDIKPKNTGERVVSGIFCWPSGSTVAYMAPIEWFGCGYEAFILGTVDDPERSMVTLPFDKGDQPIPQDQVDILYGETPYQINRLISMSLSFYESQLSSHVKHQSPPSLHQWPSVSPKNDKNQRNKEKTHSFFRVIRIDTPEDVRRSQINNPRRSWSLDHTITVNGHLRWQPYGPGLTKRKLIWIDAYDKGEGQRHRPESNPTLERMK